MYGSMVAILRDGTHRTVFGVFMDYASFKAAKRAALEAVRFKVESLFYAWVGEHQMYTHREVLEVYFNE